jgi:menaquinone-specific isochorismate synthase
MPLTVRTIALDAGVDLLDGALPGVVPTDPDWVWVRDGEGAVGWGVAHLLELESISDSGRAWADFHSGLRSPDGQKATGAIAFGAFPFDQARSAARGYLVVPRDAIVRRHGVTVHIHVEPDDLWRADGSQCLLEGLDVGDAEDDDDAAYEDSVSIAKELVAEGTLEKIVIAARRRVAVPGGVSVSAVVRILAEQQPSSWTFRMGGFVGATPELLISAQGERVHSRVLAGTRAGGWAKSDGVSRKEESEHSVAVRSAIEAVSPLMDEIHSSEPSVIELPYAAHLSTDITGSLAEGFSVLDLLARIHPTAAVAGIPREETMALISSLEGFDRRYYTGPVGWVDGAGNGEWGVALRCGELLSSGEEMLLSAGCGIMGDSDPEDELREMRLKLQPMLQALRAASGRILSVPSKER